MLLGSTLCSAVIKICSWREATVSLIVMVAHRNVEQTGDNSIAFGKLAKERKQRMQWQRFSPRVQLDGEWGFHIFLGWIFSQLFSLLQKRNPMAWHHSEACRYSFFFPQRCRHASCGDLKWLRSIRKSHYLASDRKPSITSCCRTAVVRPRPKCRQGFLPHLAPAITQLLPHPHIPVRRHSPLQLTTSPPLHSLSLLVTLERE